MKRGTLKTGATEKGGHFHVLRFHLMIATRTSDHPISWVVESLGLSCRHVSWQGETPFTPGQRIVIRALNV